MRYVRLRLRSSILVSLTTLTFFFLVTLHTLIWSVDDLEYQEQIPETSDAVPFLSAINQKNIYDINATQSNQLINHSSYITPERVEKLFQRIRNARYDEIHLSDKNQIYSNNSTWKFQRFANENLSNFNNDTNTNIDATDSAVVNPKVLFNFTTTHKTMNENDKLNLRNFLRQKINQWKIEHQFDKYRSLAEVMNEGLNQDEPTRLNTSWYEYIKTVNNHRVYDPNSFVFKRLLNLLRNGKINEAGEMSQGTQIKLVLDLPDGFQALLKPYRVPRNYQTQPDHFYFSDIERHHAEIAAFHLDKIVGFYRVPPLIGRIFNMTKDIREKATNELANTFFISPANNTCFRGHCSYYCDTSHAVCGKPGDHLEGSVQVLLPRPPEVNWQKITHPFRRSYSATRKALWETNENYCYERVMIDEDFHNRLFLDMMDLSAFDFLIGNLDRHHMMRISSFGVNTGLIHLDNGRSFGRYDFDDLTILTPIRQCCFFRYSTFSRLYRVYQKGLSKLLSDSLKTGEQLQMILIKEHLIAIDRRLEILFAHIDNCIKTYSVKNVMIDDGVD